MTCISSQKIYILAFASIILSQPGFADSSTHSAKEEEKVIKRSLLKKFPSPTKKPLLKARSALSKKEEKEKRILSFLQKKVFPRNVHSLKNKEGVAAKKPLNSLTFALKHNAPSTKISPVAQKFPETSKDVANYLKVNNSFNHQTSPLVQSPIIFSGKKTTYNLDEFLSKDTESRLAMNAARHADRIIGTRINTAVTAQNLPQTYARLDGVNYNGSLLQNHVKKTSQDTILPYLASTYAKTADVQALSLTNNLTNLKVDSAVSSPVTLNGTRAAYNLDGLGNAALLPIKTAGKNPDQTLASVLNLLITQVGDISTFIRGLQAAAKLSHGPTGHDFGRFAYIVENQLTDPTKGFNAGDTIEVDNILGTEPLSARYTITSGFPAIPTTYLSPITKSLPRT